MATSSGGGEIRISATELGEDRFVDTMLMRDLVDSALHKCDEAGQHRLNWVAPVSGVWPAGQGDRYEQAFGDNGLSGDLDVGTETEPIWYSFGLRYRYAPKLRADGSGYPLRIRLAGALDSAGTGDFGVAVVPGNAVGRGFEFWGGTPGDGSSDYPAAFLRFSGITSTTAAWLSPDSGNDYLLINSRLIEAAYDREPGYPTKVDVGGADTTLVIPTVTVIPMCATRTASVRPILYGLHVAETVGT